MLLWKRYGNNKMAAMRIVSLILHLQLYSHRLNLLYFLDKIRCQLSRRGRGIASFTRRILSLHSSTYSLCAAVVLLCVKIIAAWRFCDTDKFICTIQNCPELWNKCAKE